VGNFALLPCTKRKFLLFLGLVNNVKMNIFLNKRVFFIVECYCFFLYNFYLFKRQRIFIV
jgi:hypothetical protein